METQAQRAAIYCRISSDPEGKSAGVERQEADCRELAKRLGYSVGRVYVENDTGASTKSRKARPLYRDMLSSVAAGHYSAILAYSNSRLTRRPSEWEELIRLHDTTGVTIQTVVSGRADFSTADGRAVARTIAAWDAAEAERTAERVKRSKDEAVIQGKWRGGRRPFGYEADGITVRQSEAEALERAADEIISGRSLYAVAREMAEAGHTTSSKKALPIDPVSLRTILLRPRNAGLMEADGQIVGPATWPAIISEDKWLAVTGILKDPGRRTQTGSEVRWLGSHLFRCGVCGGVVRAATVTGVDRERRSVYRCKTGRHVNRDQPKTDAYVLAVIEAFLNRPDIASSLPRQDPTQEKAHAANTELQALRTRRAQLVDDYAAGLLDGQQVRAATVRLDGLIEAAEQSVREATDSSILASVLSSDSPGKSFLAASLDRQRAIIDALAVVTIQPAPRGRPKGHVPGTPYFDPSYIDIRQRF